MAWPIVNAILFVRSTPIRSTLGKGRDGSENDGATGGRSGVGLTVGLAIGTGVDTCNGTCAALEHTKNATAANVAVPIKNFLTSNLTNINTIEPPRLKPR